MVTDVLLEGCVCVFYDRIRYLCMRQAGAAYVDVFGTGCAFQVRQGGAVLAAGPACPDILKWFQPYPPIKTSSFCCTVAGSRRTIVRCAGLYELGWFS
jgi:hypothetical protein